ncbi:MAG: hypothetical protein LBJ36_03915 [Synergistaceae bacterium]|jgi:putative transposase|nr:hypothetical protein [Synergistaceae bacterium]
MSNDQFDVKGFHIRIPNLGWVKMRESLRLTGKIMSATVSRVANKWFVSITVDTLDDSCLPKAETQGVVGVDCGRSGFKYYGTGDALDGRMHSWTEGA